jgi:endonuclease/exonuclease/phosphatase family metal-dependent hydrolase
VWALLETAYRRFGVLPTVLEGDFNLPPLSDLLEEVATNRDIQVRVGAAVLASAREAGEAALARIASELAHPRPDRVLAGGRETLEGLRARAIVLGSRPPAS